MTLYLLTNTVTGMRYVGATQQPLSRRLAEHRRNAFAAPRNYPLYAGMREHGWSAFHCEVLARPETHDELMRLETETIAQLGTMFPAGYNYTAGGLGTHKRPFSDATKARMSAKKANYVPWNAGKRTGPLTAEHRAKLSASHKGQIPWNHYSKRAAFVVAPKGQQ